MTTENITPGPIKSGRPRNDDTKKRFYDGELYALLIKHLPQHIEGGRLSPKSLAAAIEVHKFTVYKWLNKDVLSPKGARLLIKESGDTLTIEDLSKFVLA